MTLLDKIQDRVRQLPPEKQSEVLDFINSLQEMGSPRPARPRSLRQHRAFGSWRERQIDALKYEQALRTEWDR